MRTTLTIALSLCALLGACQSTDTPSVNADADTGAYSKETIAASSARLRINGMSCPKCATNIQRQLATIPGVHDLAIDLGAGVVDVAFVAGGPHPSRAQLARAIERTGFTLVSIDAGG